MRQFDIYLNEGDSREQYPYLIVLQNVLLNHIDSIVVAPIAFDSLQMAFLPKFAVKVNIFEKD
ncbi:hypothetical protein EP331_09050 [bacterium]|nr:MAG: hypothetical protein EP331_09050 [bacterium]